jgi:uncharacterized membrane protein
MAVVFLTIGARVAMVWDRLPPVMASHFGAGGRPDGWMPRGTFFGLMSAIGLGLPLLFFFSEKWMKAIPTRLVNIPNREYWLTPERTNEALGKLGSFMAWYGLTLSVFMAFVLELTIRSNLNRAPFDSSAMLIGLGGLFAVSIGMFIRLHRQLRVPRE